jgi:DNA-binding NtrC family response regulator
MLQLVCQQRGFTVWTASDSPTGIEVYRRHHAQIALVLLDVCMPNLDGPATLVELQKIAPEVRCCFMSGHLGVYSTEELKVMGALGLFVKPFKVAELVEELWRLAVEDLRKSA